MLLWLHTALQSHPEPLEGSAHSGSRGRHKETLQFSAIDISHHAHTASISIHNLSGGGHWGEEQSERRRQHSREIQWGIEPSWVIYLPICASLILSLLLSSARFQVPLKTEH